ERPHCFCSVDGGTASHGYDPVWLESAHSLSALHNGLHRRIRLYAFKYFYFHTAFLQVVHCLVQEALALHGTASYYQECFLSFQILQFCETSLSMIDVSRQCKSAHSIFLLRVC